MFENPSRSRLARNFTTNVPKILDLKSSSEQIFSENWRWVPLLWIRTPKPTIFETAIQSGLFWIWRVWWVCVDDWSRILLKSLRHKPGSSLLNENFQVQNGGQQCCRLSSPVLLHALRRRVKRLRSWPDCWKARLSGRYQVPFSVIGKRSISNESWTFQL